MRLTRAPYFPSSLGPFSNLGRPLSWTGSSLCICLCLCFMLVIMHNHSHVDGPADRPQTQAEHERAGRARVHTCEEAPGGVGGDAGRTEGGVPGWGSAGEGD